MIIGKIRIDIEDDTFDAEMYDTPTARRVLEMMPFAVTLTRWGKEYYGDIGIDVEPDKDARDVMELGEIAIWPVGGAICIFFGATPVSVGDEPRAASPVNPVGRIVWGTPRLEGFGPEVSARFEMI